MSDATAGPRAWGRPRFDRRRAIMAGALVVLLVAMVLSTKFVGKNSPLNATQQAFSPTKYGAKQFPLQQKFIATHAVDAKTLATALAAGQPAAAKKYGVAVNDGATTEVPVTFSGVVGKVPAAGYTPVKVAGLPAGTSVNVQLGPAIIGTDLRDATGKIELGQFQNQIEFQNAATAINNESKKLLAKAGAPNLTGKTITVTGVFTLVNPQLWNVTAASLSVKP